MKQEYALMPHRILRYSTPKKALSIVLLICVSPCPLLSHPAPCCLTLPHAVSPCPRKCSTLPRGVPNCPQMCCLTKTAIQDRCFIFCSSFLSNFDSFLINDSNETLLAFLSLIFVEIFKFKVKKIKSVPPSPALPYTKTSRLNNVTVLCQH